MKYLLPIILLLTGCINVPVERLAYLDPELCRQFGVDVADGAEKTGTLVGSYPGTIGGIYKSCEESGVDSAGCAIAVEGGWPSPSHRYNIYYTSVQIAGHEYCHIAYEEFDHTLHFDIFTYQNGMTWVYMPKLKKLPQQAAN